MSMPVQVGIRFGGQRTRTTYVNGDVAQDVIVLKYDDIFRLGIEMILSGTDADAKFVDIAGDAWYLAYTKTGLRVACPNRSIEAHDEGSFISLMKNYHVDTESLTQCRARCPGAMTSDLHCNETCEPTTDNDMTGDVTVTDVFADNCSKRSRVLEISSQSAFDAVDTLRNMNGKMSRRAAETSSLDDKLGKIDEVIDALGSTQDQFKLLKQSKKNVETLRSNIAAGKQEMERLAAQNKNSLAQLEQENQKKQSICAAIQKNAHLIDSMIY